VERWSKEGRIPFLTSLINEGVWTRLDSTRGLFSDSPWPSFNAGVSPAKHAFYNHLQIKRGTTEIERIDAHHCRYLPFWSLLQDSGKKVAIFDVPKTFPVGGLDGVAVSAWGEHYPLLKQPASQTPDFVSDLIRRFGKYPHPREITQPWSAWQERRIYKTLSSNLEKKLRATEYLMNLQDWDLFMSVFSEVHYAGHQFYHHAKEEHWAHDPKAPNDLHEAMPRLYAQLDRAIANLFRQISDKTTFLIVSVHGFATNYSANHLMPEVLEKLGYLVPAARAKHTNGLGDLLQLTSFVRSLIPQSVRDLINTHIVPEAVHDTAYSNAFSTGVDWEKTKAFFLPSDHFQAYISLNLKGREPFGTIQLGAEFDKLCDEIRHELKQLVNPATGRPAVREVVRTSDVYQGPSLYDLPDLVVQWAEDAPINQLRHPRFGNVSQPGFPLRKTQHSSEGFMIAGGRHIAKNAILSGVSTLDIAPTILYLMGQMIPEEMDGRVLLELIDEEFKRNNEPVYGSRPQILPKGMGFNNL
jgi:predicted AlkP superfamily phosphohydrolase/phosphomutase